MWGNTQNSLEGLKRCCRYKDSSRPSDDENDDDEDAPGLAISKSKNCKKKKNPGKKKKKKLPIKKPSNASQGNKASSAAPEYQAGNYSDERLKWIRALSASEGLSFRQASDRWNHCSRRSELLQGMSESELKRRRFLVIPKGKNKA